MLKGTGSDPECWQKCCQELRPKGETNIKCNAPWFAILSSTRPTTHNCLTFVDNRRLLARRKIFTNTQKRYSFCDDFDHSKLFFPQIEYPNNLLRNIAKHGVPSKYALVVDIDMKPNPDLYNDFMNFSIRNNLFDGGNSLYNGEHLSIEVKT